MSQRNPPPPPPRNKVGIWKKPWSNLEKYPIPGDVSLNQNVTYVGTTMETKNEQKPLAVCYRISPSVPILKKHSDELMSTC